MEPMLVGARARRTLLELSPLYIIPKGTVRLFCVPEGIVSQQIGEALIVRPIEFWRATRLRACRSTTPAAAGHVHRCSMGRSVRSFRWRSVSLRRDSAASTVVTEKSFNRAQARAARSSMSSTRVLATTSVAAGLLAVRTLHAIP